MRTPPLNAIKTFESISRHLSVTKAADELNVTQGAASQQLKNLEEYFNSKLFIRSASGMSLTDSGRKLAAVVQKALTQIYTVSEEILGVQKTTLSISAPPSFAVKWLIPNLEKFYFDNPDVNIIIDASPEIRDFRADSIDGSIRYSLKTSVDSESTILSEASNIIVASPEYLSKFNPVTEFSQLMQHKLISYEPKSESHKRMHKSWQTVFNYYSLDFSRAQSHLIFAEEHMASTAAVHGHGIALAEVMLVTPEIKSGQLAKVLDINFPTDYCYSFVKPENTQKLALLERFEKWIGRAFQESRDSPNLPIMQAF